MIGDSRPISVKVEAEFRHGGIRRRSEHRPDDDRTRDQCAEAGVSKRQRRGNGEILVRYQVDEANWRLSVSDNGVGLQQDGNRRRHTRLGTTIVEALAHQLKARGRDNQSIARNERLDRSQRIDAMGRHRNARGDKLMSIGLILVIILIIFLLGGFSGRFGGYGYGYGHGGVGIIGIVLIIIVVLMLLGRI